MTHNKSGSILIPLNLTCLMANHIKNVIRNMNVKQSLVILYWLSYLYFIAKGAHSVLTQNQQGQLHRKQLHIITPKTEDLSPKWATTAPIRNALPLWHSSISAWPHLTETSDDFVLCSSNRIINKMKCNVSFHYLLFNNKISLQVFAYKINCP